MKPPVPDSRVVDTVRPSPNRRPRTAAEQVRLVILHGTWMADDAAALARLTDPATEVSSHYYIARDGQVTQLVAERDVAWHAGRSRWQVGEVTYDGVNGHSIGIEIGNTGPFGDVPPAPGQETVISDKIWATAEPYTEAAYAALVELLRDILQRYGLKVDAVLGHDQVAPDRKSDPGRHFDWARLRTALQA